MKKRIALLPLLSLALLPLFAACAWALALPDIPGYTGEEARVTPLTAPSGSQGTWIARTYRDAAGRTVHGTLLSGSGTGTLRAEPGAKGDDFPIGFGSTYEVLELDGRRAVLEDVPTLGRALAVAVEKNVTLTLESSSLSGEELQAVARAIMAAIDH